RTSNMTDPGPGTRPSPNNNESGYSIPRRQFFRASLLGYPPSGSPEGPWRSCDDAVPLGRCGGGRVRDDGTGRRPAAGVRRGGQGHAGAGRRRPGADQDRGVLPPARGRSGLPVRQAGGGVRVPGDRPEQGGGVPGRVGEVAAGGGDGQG